MAYLDLFLDGLSEEEIRGRWGTTIENVRGTAKRIQAHTGMDDLRQVAELARPRIEQVRQGLPLEGRVHSPANRAKWTWTQHRLQILGLLARQMRRELIAAELGISRKTVDNHISDMMKQMGAKNWQGLLEKATEKGLLV